MQALSLSIWICLYADCSREWAGEIPRDPNTLKLTELIRAIKEVSYIPVRRFPPFRNAGLFFSEYSRYSIQLEDVIHDCKWSKGRFDAELEKGYNDMLNGRVTPLDDVYAKLSEAISEIKNGAQGVDAEESIKGMKNS